MKLLPLICLSVCVTAGAQLVQSPPYVTVILGSKVILQCDITGIGEAHGCSRVAWLRVGQVSSLSVIPQISGTQSGTRCRLEILSATLQDAGRYYCVYVEGPMLIPGNGTMLTVTESELHSPAVDVLAPSHVNSSLPVPLVCLASGLKDAGRVKVNWEVDSKEDDGACGLQHLSPVFFPDSRVISTQVYVPAETWSAGVEVSCVLSDGELRLRKTISSRTGESSQCVFLTSIFGAICVILFTATLMLSILLSRRQRQLKETSEGPSKISEEASPELHYAALRFSTSGRRNIS